MKKGKKIKKLNRVTSHRKAMLKNMAVSLLDHEQIITSRAKAKALRPFVEKLITKAKYNLNENLPPERKLHNKRYVMRFIKNRKIVVKLFDDIAKRFENRNGGYVRIIHLPERNSDSAQLSIVELVEKRKTKRIPRRELIKQQKLQEEKERDLLTRKKDKKEKETTDVTQVKKKQEKWYHKFKFGFGKKKEEKSEEKKEKDKNDQEQKEE
ncbi:MAG: 50S ribosomal protein L17 [Leptospiraceae bacterium]|nr:50S ribosomal protein L17 [Leptospiraceae bacterium]MDW7975198.1 50S ribosomal protein L17 [Leptospiraceae bacterium]